MQMLGSESYLLLFGIVSDDHWSFCCSMQIYDECSMIVVTASDI